MNIAELIESIRLGLDPYGDLEDAEEIIRRRREREAQYADFDADSMSGFTPKSGIGGITVPEPPPSEVPELTDVSLAAEAAVAGTPYERAMQQIEEQLAAQDAQDPGPAPDPREEIAKIGGPKFFMENEEGGNAGYAMVADDAALDRIRQQAAAMGSGGSPSDILLAAGAGGKFRTPSPQEVADATVVGPKSTPGPMYMEGGPPPYAGGEMRQGASEPSLYGGRTPESMMKSYGWMEDAFPQEDPKSAEQVLLERAQTRPVYKRSPHGGGVIERGLDQEAVTATAYLEEMAKRKEQSRLAELGFAKDLLVADKYSEGRGSSDPLDSTTGINQLASRLLETIVQDPNISPDQAIAAQREIIRVLYGGSPEEKRELLAKYGGGGATGGGGYEAEDDYLGKMGL